MSPREPSGVSSSYSLLALRRWWPRRVTREDPTEQDFSHSAPRSSMAEFVDTICQQSTHGLSISRNVRFGAGISLTGISAFGRTRTDLEGLPAATTAPPWGGVFATGSGRGRCWWPGRRVPCCRRIAQRPLSDSAARSRHSQLRAHRLWRRVHRVANCQRRSVCRRQDRGQGYRRSRKLRRSRWKARVS